MPQKPLLGAYERYPKKVQRWLDEEYPAIEERAKQQGGIIFLAYGTGICNDPQHGRGYALKEKAPAFEHHAKRSRINMISALDNRGKVRFMLYKENMTAKVLLRFLKLLIKNIKDKVFVILDNLRVHHAYLVLQWAAKNDKKLSCAIYPLTRRI